MITSIITTCTHSSSTRLVGVVVGTCDDGCSFFSFILLRTAPIGGTMIKFTLQPQPHKEKQLWLNVGTRTVRVVVLEWPLRVQSLELALEVIMYTYVRECQHVLFNSWYIYFYKFLFMSYPDVQGWVEWYRVLLQREWWAHVRGLWRRSSLPAGGTKVLHEVLSEPSHARHCQLLLIMCIPCLYCLS